MDYKGHFRTQDGSKCHPLTIIDARSRFLIRSPVTGTLTTHELLWSQLVDGHPEATVNPAEISGIQWAFPVPAGVGTASPEPYRVDLRVDDLTFLP